MSASQVRPFLNARINFERVHQAPYAKRVFKLDRMHDLAARLGNIERRIPLIHVAGTKGKGSVTAMLASILREAGYRVGTYTSPHLVNLGERIGIDGVPSSDQELAEALAIVAPHVEAMEQEAAGRGEPEDGPTFFEILTALAFVRFQQAEADIGILESGLGGRLDSTNVCRPIVTAITNIDYDHTHLLGKRLTDIAREKGGILKRGVPFVCGVSQEEPRNVLRVLANEVGSPLRELGVDFAVQDEAENHFALKGDRRYRR